jgi:hypothetical protein
MIRYCHSRQCRRLAFKQTLEDNRGSNGSQRTSTGPEEVTCLTPRQSLTTGENIYPQLCDNCQRKRSESSPTSSSSSSLSEASQENEAIRRIFEQILEVFQPPPGGTVGTKGGSRGGGGENQIQLTLIQLMKMPQLKTLIKTTNKTRETSQAVHLPSTSFDWECLIVSMIERYFLDIHLHFTPYSSLCYIVRGDRRGPITSDIVRYLQDYFLRIPEGKERDREKDREKGGEKDREKGGEKRRKGTAGLIDLT